VVAEICDRVIVMYGGVIVEQGRLKEVFDDPRHPYTRLLLEAFPDLEHPDRRLASIPGSPPRLDDLPPGCRFAPRCPIAVDRCHGERPEETSLAPGRTVACFLAEGVHA
jgi:oligopeptide/dipeptide ABC transporter ATP-binding protein